MILVEILSIILRLAELSFGAIVAGINGRYLYYAQATSTWEQSRFIYTVVVAALSILLALLWLFPFSSAFVHWPTDLLLAVLYFVAFGLLVNYLDPKCGYVFDWSVLGFRTVDTCPTWKAGIAFSFLSAICWLVSGLLGIYWTSRHVDRRRRWY